MQGQQEAAQQQAMAQQQGPPQQPPQGVNVIELADAYARKVSSMAPHEQAAVLQRIRQSNPQLHNMVQEKMGLQNAMAQRPLPEQRPPRRADQVI